jgi:Na+-transporting methylmalonyl-CoA/oxaloacetate decarboxylase gamma subunit
MEAEQKKFVCGIRWQVLKFVLIVLGMALVLFLIAQIMFGWWIAKLIWSFLLWLIKSPATMANFLKDILKDAH